LRGIKWIKGKNNVNIRGTPVRWGTELAPIETEKGKNNVIFELPTTKFSMAPLKNNVIKENKEYKGG